jgi:hypothetical protein
LTVLIRQEFVAMPPSRFCVAAVFFGGLGPRGNARKLRRTIETLYLP